jgi:4a-hydroxytetrahydrobiopterin dehydratase
VKEPLLGTAGSRAGWTRYPGYVAGPGLLDDHRVDEAIAGGLAWRRDGGQLVKTWLGEDFAAALAYVNKVGELAERANHHPDVDIRWGTVTLRLSTHSMGGLTQADLDLAAQIDQLG